MCFFTHYNFFLEMAINIFRPKSCLYSIQTAVGAIQIIITVNFINMCTFKASADISLNNQ